MFSVRPLDAQLRQDVLNLRLYEHQKGYVEPVAQCLQEAESCRFFEPAALLLEGKVVGFAMYGEFPNELEGRRVWLDRLLLDRDSQGRGLGKVLVRELVDYLRREYGCRRIYLSLFDDNRVTRHIYEALGFVFNGELDRQGERIMVLE